MGSLCAFVHVSPNPAVLEVDYFFFFQVYQGVIISDLPSMSDFIGKR